MGSVCNRMLRKIVTAPLATKGTIIGKGFEGLLNGGATMTATFDGTGVLGLAATTQAVTITIWQRATPGGSLVANATTVNLPAGGKVCINLTGLCDNEVQFTAQAVAVGDQQITVESLTTRAA